MVPCLWCIIKHGGFTPCGARCYSAIWSQLVPPHSDVSLHRAEFILEPARDSLTQSTKQFGERDVVALVVGLEILLRLRVHRRVHTTLAPAQTLGVMLIQHLTVEAFLWVVPATTQARGETVRPRSRHVHIIPLHFTDKCAIFILFVLRKTHIFVASSEYKRSCTCCLNINYMLTTGKFATGQDKNQVIEISCSNSLGLFYFAT